MVETEPFDKAKRFTLYLYAESANGRSTTFTVAKLGNTAQFTNADPTRNFVDGAYQLAE